MGQDMKDQETETSDNRAPSQVTVLTSCITMLNTCSTQDRVVNTIQLRDFHKLLVSTHYTCLYLATDRNG